MTFTKAGWMVAMTAVMGLTPLLGQERVQRQESDDQRLALVAAFADHVLERGRDRWSGQDTPLLADGIDPVSGDPALWWHDGRSYIIHNLASQQNLFRVLRGLSRLTGEERYEQAARAAVRYHFDHLRSPCGKLRWGGHQFIDLKDLQPVGRFDANCHEFKSNFPFYELMWDVDPEATTQFIRALWAGHVTDWNILDMNRHSRYHDGPPPAADVWNRPFAEPQPYFEGDGLTFLNAGADLIYAGSMLFSLAGEQGALDWALRMAGMYTKARHPDTGMGTYQYSKPRRQREPPAEGPLVGRVTGSTFGDRIENKFGRSGSSDPGDEFYNPVKDKVAADGLLVAREGWVWSGSGGFPWYTLVQLALAETVGDKTAWFAADAADHLEAHARHAYDPETNHFRPMWSDGTDVSGLKIPRTGYGVGREGEPYRASRASATHLAAYTRAYRQTRRDSLWQTARAMARGLGLGEIGETPQSAANLDGAVASPDPELIFALLELYRVSPRAAYLDTARELADRMIAARFHHGFFMPTPEHRYANFNAREPLALLTLDAVLRGEPELVPVYVGSRGYIHGQFDGRGRTYDHQAVWAQLRTDPMPKPRPPEERRQPQPPAKSEDGVWRFDGRSHVLTMNEPPAAFGDDDQFSIVLRVRPYDDRRFLCAFRYHLSSNEFQTRGTDPLQVVFDLRDREEPRWLAITYDGKGEGGSRTLRVYIDGQEAGSATGTGSPLSSYAARPLALGYTHHSGGGYSRIDVHGDLRVLNRVLTAEEAAAIARER